MGYYTQYAGSLKITPPLSKTEYLRLIQTVNFWNSESVIKHATADVFDNTLPNLLPEDQAMKDERREVTFSLNPDTIEAPEDSVKGYGDDEGLQAVAFWLDANGHKLEGEATWDGEENGDRGTIYAAHVNRKNKVEFVRDEISNPGPSWEKATAKQ